MNLKHKIELLSPAKDYETLKVAIDAGADAIYLGGDDFSARKSANSFDKNTLQEAVDYAHLRDVKIHVAVNTLIKDTEMKDCLLYVDFLHSSGVDALIVQDIGLINLIREFFPDIQLHISTQAAVIKSDDVIFFENLGAKRVVLPRETTLQEINQIRKKSKMPLEVFAHGALCVSYSGRCLFSALNGGRSGNRGDCAQVCRKPYTLELDGKTINDENSKYVLSPKDLNTSQDLEKLIQSGINSLKIEGRMKNPDYVRAVTASYRFLTDEYYRSGKISEKSKEEAQNILLKVFNRGFTGGYILGEKGSSIINSFSQKPLGQPVASVLGYNARTKKLKLKLLDDLQKGDGTSLGEKIGRIIKYSGKNVQKEIITDSAKKGDIVFLDFLKSVAAGQIIYKTSSANIALPSNGKKKIDVHLSCSVKQWQNPSLTLKYKKHFQKFTSDFTVQEAKSSPVDYYETLKRLTKTDTYPFNIIVDDADIDADVFVPVKVLNELRRNAFAEFEKTLLQKKDIPSKKAGIESFFGKIVPKPQNQAQESIKNSLQNPMQKAGFSQYSGFSKNNVIQIFVLTDDSADKRLISTLKDDFEKNISEKNNTEEKLTNSNLANQIDLIFLDKSNIFSDYSSSSKPECKIASYDLNIYNSFAHCFYNNIGKYTICSLENVFANSDEYIYSCDKSKTVIPANVYPPLMYTKFCPHKDDKGKCKYEYDCQLSNTTITNEQGDVFTFKKADSSCNVIIEHSTPKTLNTEQLREYIKKGYSNFYFEIRTNRDAEQLKGGVLRGLLKED